MKTEPATVDQRTVPFFDYPGAFRPMEEQFVDTFRDVLRRGAFILQADLARFEANLASYLGVAHAIGVANATDGMLLALRAADIGAGDEVILPSHTMVATAAAVHFVGATPVLVECGSDHLIDPQHVAESVTSRTRAIMPVQLNGRTADMDALTEIAEAHGLLIVEDSAQGLGSRFKDRLAGTFGIAGTFSFYPAKILGCMGDGGAVVTNDDAVAHRLRLLRDHGRDPATGEVLTWGLNSRLDNLQAALLDLQLADFDNVVARRRQVAGMYEEALSDLEQLHLPPAPDAHPDHFDTFQNYELEAMDRDALRAFLRTCGVGTLVQWGGKALHQIGSLGLGRSLPVTDRVFERALMLPMNMCVSDDDVAYVASCVRRFYEDR